ncbi:MAG: DNA mismatch repair endonuclease MutL [Bacteroidales bacterium]
MSDIIQLLPDAVANQIAAGEVIQRPASVVKELLENAVDAGANDIKVIVKDAGRTLIQVIDNGSGMTSTDLRLSIERHATSKIKTAHDLFAIRSMGFRGEALPSIAAISHLEIKSKRQEDDLGTILTVEGSQVTNQKPVNTAKGTSISVKNLFFNVPARRNFLKSNQVEMRHVLEEFNRVALANPGIAMELYDKDQPKFQLPSSNLKQRIVNLFGKQHDQRLVPVNVETTLVNIHGFTGKPEFAKKTRGEQYLFVNNRYFKNFYFNHAIENAYDRLLPEKSHASYFLFFDIDPKKIDINIHPTKTEVNFEDGQSIYAILRSGVKKALGQHNLTPSLDFETEQSIASSGFDSNRTPRQPNIKVSPGYNPFEQKSGGPISQSRKDRHNRENWSRMYEQTPDTDQNAATTASQDAQSEPDLSSSGEIIQVRGEFIMTAVKSGVMLIQQQRAHERILYEHFLQRLQNEDGSSQKLMFPEKITLNPSDSDLFEEIKEDIQALGFAMKKNDAHQWEFLATPAGFKHNIQTLIESVLEDYKSQMMNASFNRHTNLAMAMARRTAIKTGKKLVEEEMKSLIDSLFACSMPQQSLDGKPVIQIIRHDEIKEKFN